MAEEIDVEKCNIHMYGQTDRHRDPDLDLGLGQGHISMHNTYRTMSDSSLNQYGNMAL